MASAVVHHMALLHCLAVLADLSLKHLAHTDLGHMDIPSVHNPAHIPAAQHMQTKAKSFSTDISSTLPICDK